MRPGDIISRLEDLTREGRYGRATKELREFWKKGDRRQAQRSGSRVLVGK